jgi:hypothetical protein
MIKYLVVFVPNNNYLLLRRAPVCRGDRRVMQNRRLSTEAHSCFTEIVILAFVARRENLGDFIRENRESVTVFVNALLVLGGEGVRQQANIWSRDYLKALDDRKK